MAKIIIDKDLEIQQYSPICSFCIHSIDFLKCKAFLKIPLEIWEGNNKHRKPLPDQDNDIVFEKIKE